MKFRDLIYVLTTILVILIWSFIINVSNLQEIFKRPCEERALPADYFHLQAAIETGRRECGNPDIFKSHLGCCPHKDCPADHFPFHLHSGVANVIPPKICFNNTVIMGGIRNNAGHGLNIVLINGQAGVVLESNYFNMKSGDPEQLLAYLKTIRPGNIVLVASHVDPATKLTDEIREIFSVLGSTMVKSVKPRDSWVFAGAYRINKDSPFEKIIQNDLSSNVYKDWPEMVEIFDCFPKSLFQ